MARCDILKQNEVNGRYKMLLAMQSGWTAPFSQYLQSGGYGTIGPVRYARTSPEAHDNVKIMLQAWQDVYFYSGAWHINRADPKKSFAPAGAQAMLDVGGEGHIFQFVGQTDAPLIPYSVVSSPYPVCGCTLSAFCAILALIEIQSGYNPFYSEPDSIRAIFLTPAGAYPAGCIKNSKKPYGLFQYPNTHALNVNIASTGNGHGAVNHEGSQNEYIGDFITRQGGIQNWNLNNIAVDFIHGGVHLYQGNGTDTGITTAGIPSLSIAEQFVTAFCFQDANYMGNCFDGMPILYSIDIDSLTPADFNSYLVNEFFAGTRLFIHNAVSSEVFAEGRNTLTHSANILRNFTDDEKCLYWNPEFNEDKGTFKTFSNVFPMFYSDTPAVLPWTQTPSGVYRFSTPWILTGAGVDNPEDAADYVLNHFAVWHYNKFSAAEHAQARDAARYWYNELGGETRCEWVRRTKREYNYILYL